MSSSVRRFKKVGILLAKSISQIVSRSFKAFALLLLAAYRTLFTTHLGGACRFEPSCSAYALEAFRGHAPLYASSLTLKRLCKCRPGGPFGYDPVPPSVGSGEKGPFATRMTLHTKGQGL